MRRVLSFDMGTRNLAYALVENPNRILRMGMIDLRTNNTRQATKTLINTLHGSNAWMLDSDHDVVVELQPSSGVCKTLSHVLQGVFYSFDLCTLPEPRDFVFMQAGQKLLYNPTVLAQINPQTYRARKQCAIAMAEIVLQDNQELFRTFFAKHAFKQQSDLADAIVQGCRHFQRNALI